MSLKKGKEAIAELLDKMKVAATTEDVKELANKAHAFVTFAEMDDKKARISKTEGNKLSDLIDQAQAERLDKLASA